MCVCCCESTATPSPTLSPTPTARRRLAVLGFMQPVGELAAKGKKGSSWPLTSTVPLVFLVLVVVALVFVYLLVILLVVVSKAAPLLTASVTVLVVRISLPAHVILA